MRTLHVDTGREMRGGQWQVLYLVERLPDAVLLARKDSPLYREARQRGLNVQPLSFAKLALMARQAELVHAHDARSHTLAVFAGGAPCLVSRRVAFPVKETFASKLKYGRAVKYLAVSKFVAGRLVEAGVPASKVRVVYDGVPLPPPAEPEPGRVVALQNKGGEILRLLAKSANVPIHFTSNLWQDLSKASIFLYVSEMEGLGSAALAAMAAGVPVIATRVGGLPEIVEHECTGLLVDGPGSMDHDIGQLTGALRRLLDHPAEAAAMGRRGRERVEQSFSVESMVKNTQDAYREALR